MKEKKIERTVSKFKHYQKLWGGVPSTTPPPPPVGGMNLCMSLRPRVKPEVKEVDASRNKREFQNFALVCRVLMFIFAPLIKFSDNLRDLFSIICAPISRYTLD